MRILKYLFAALAVVSISLIAMASSPFDSVTSRVSGLENDSIYMSLLVQEQQLKIVEDSIQQQINSIRANFNIVAQEDRVSLGRLILDAENALFEVRNQTGIVTGQINNIEQQYIISNLNMNTDISAQATETQADPSFFYSQGSSDLYSNRFFEDNLSDEDLESLNIANELEKELYNLEEKYFTNYEKLSLLKIEYDSCSNQYTADTIQNMFYSVSALNQTIEDSIASNMSYVFDNKLYTLSYIYDKMNNSNMLRSLEEGLSDMRNQISERPSDAIAATIYNLPLQRGFLLDQEISLARHLKVSAAMDSLNNLKAKLSEYDLKSIEIIERNFIEYAPIVKVTTQLYNARNPIPRLEHYVNGTVYRISVGSFSSAQAVSVFRSTTPVYVDVVGSRYNYYLGGFATLEEAVQAQAQLKDIGFRRPEIVVWVNDVFEKLDDTTVASTSSRTSSSKLYRVEIQMNDAAASLSASHQQSISAVASGKELSKLFSSEGHPIFAVGTFTSTSEAEALADALNAHGDCTATVKAL